MTRRIQNLLAIALALLLLSFHVRLKRQADPRQVEEMAKEASMPRLWKGKVAPNFELTRTDGRKFLLADHVGKEVVILNFFATWCGPCRAETPELNRFVLAQKGKPVLLIGIDAGEKPELVAAYIRDLHVGFPVVIDGGKVAERYAVQGFPVTVVIGPDGKVALYESGSIANADVAFGAEVKAGLETIAKGGAIKPEEYVAMAKSETYYEVRTSGAAVDADTLALAGRAKKIAETMHCVCGCSDTLEKCQCATAKGMKKKLRDAKLDGTNDVAVMEQINAEFCMKGM